MVVRYCIARHEMDHLPSDTHDDVIWSSAGPVTRRMYRSISIPVYCRTPDLALKINRFKLTSCISSNRRLGLRPLYM